MAVTSTHRIEANLSGSAIADQNAKFEDSYDTDLTLAEFDAVTPAWDKEVGTVGFFDGEARHRR